MYSNEIQQDKQPKILYYKLNHAKNLYSECVEQAEKLSEKEIKELILEQHWNEFHQIKNISTLPVIIEYWDALVQA